MYVTVVPYDSRWPEAYAREAEAIRQVLGEALVAIQMCIRDSSQRGSPDCPGTPPPAG